MFIVILLALIIILCGAYIAFDTNADNGVIYAIAMISIIGLISITI